MSHREQDGRQHQHSTGKMWLTLVSHAYDHGHQSEQQRREKTRTCTAEPPRDREHHERANKAPRGRVGTRHDVEVARLPKDVRVEIDCIAQKA